MRAAGKAGGKLFSPVAERLGRYAKVFFKGIVKMALAGEAQIAADFPDGFPGIAQQDFGLLQLGAYDEGTEIESQFLFEFMGQVGAAEAGMLRHGFYGQMYISGAV